MLVVFFYGYLLEHLGNGPIWSARVGREAARCRENWWTNFLYINNYVNTNQLVIKILKFASLKCYSNYNY